jgi:voltage-dependent potassium channel beta subunit
MQYNRLGSAGLKISELGFGSWLTFGDTLTIHDIKQCLHYAFDQGINFFDNAEVYANGQAEILMGEALKEFRRESLIISTKIFWGGNGPNDVGLSRKHLIEGTKNSLKRLQLDYVDLLYCHRPDPDTPIAETVLAMDYLIRGGYAFYWGTSEWSAEEIESAFQLAKELGCIAPTMEQPQYNLLHRKRMEQEYSTLLQTYGMGTTIWSPLAFGLLTGKYNNGIPADSRLAKSPERQGADLAQKITKVKKLMPIADELGCSVAQLAIAWCLKNPYVSCAIVGASNIKQLQENLQAIEVKTKLSPAIMTSIDSIFREDA